jgi:hypothetical protein
MAKEEGLELGGKVLLRGVQPRWQLENLVSHVGSPVVDVLEQATGNTAVQGFFVHTSSLDKSPTDYLGTMSNATIAASCEAKRSEDRPTRSHAYMFLFSKSDRYYYDVKAVSGRRGRRLRTVWDINTGLNQVNVGKPAASRRFGAWRSG